MSFENSRIITYPDIEFKQEYRIDENGNIWSPWRGWSLMGQTTSKQGYKNLYLYTLNKGRKCFKVHRLVMETFNHIEGSEELQVNHIDGNKSNNNLSNLEWCTRSENLRHAFSTGLQNIDGEKNPSHKLTEENVLGICKKLKNKVSYDKIAFEYKVSKGTIAHIRQKRTWKHITENFNFD